MMNLKILLVEDDASQIEIVQDFCDNLSFEVNLTVVNDLDSALREVFSNSFDGILVDLHLTSLSQAPEGVELVKRVRETSCVPVFVITGFPEDIGGVSENEYLYGVYRRDQIDYDGLFDKILNIKRTGILDSLSSNGDLLTDIRTIFWNYFSKNLSSLIDEKIEKAGIVRAILCYLSEKYQVDAFAGGKANPIDMFIIPMMKEKLSTGDIVKSKNKDIWYVVLSPACDVAQNKADKIQLCELEAFTDKKSFFSKKIKKIKNDSTTEDEKENLKKQCSDLIGNAGSLKYHFLPKCNSFPGGLLNFHRTSSFSPTEVANEFEVVGHITNAFLKDLIARFSMFYARQGQPDFDRDSILESMLASN